MPQPSGKSWVEAPQYNYVKSAFATGLSGNVIYETIKGTEFGMRRTNFYNMLADIRGFYINADRIKFTPRSLRVDPRNFTLGSERQKDRYQYELQRKDYVPGVSPPEGSGWRIGSSTHIPNDQVFKRLAETIEESERRDKYPPRHSPEDIEEEYNVIAVYARPDVYLAEFEF